MFGKSKKLVMCQACRALIDSSTRVCPLCGRESVPPVRIRLSEHAEHTRFFTLLILTINVVLFGLMAAVELNSGAKAGSFLNGASSPVLYDFGGRLTPAITSGQWWRLITPIFLHIGVMHLMFNSFALYQIGPIVEETYGSQKFIFFYLATGIVGNIGSYVFAIQGAGASGAIFGLIGLTAIYGYRMGGSMGQSLMRQMLVWAGIGLVLGGVIGADNVNHIGGLITGVALGFLIRPEPPTISREATMWNGVAILCAALITVSFAIVGVNYGKLQRRDDYVRLDQRVTQLEMALDDSWNWHGASDGDPHKLAAKIKSAASDVEQVSHIDDPSDQLKRRLVDVGRRRADLLDLSDKDAGGPAKAANQDFADAKAAVDDYNKWWNGLAGGHLLQPH
jgi:rhomboid protease GluP